MKKKIIFFLLIILIFIFFQSNNSLDSSINDRPIRTLSSAGAGSVESGTMGANPYSIIHPQNPQPFNSLLNTADLNRELTLFYINQYTRPAGLESLRVIMQRASPYLAFIQREIDRMGLPRELIYLPVIESAYLSTAISRSGAMGLWQFMTNSIAPFNIRVTEWKDERRDFWKSTEAALRKLEENYNFFNDWPLALAAYNAGLGGVSRLIRDTGINDYWTLSARGHLRTETIHYVPKLLAVSYVLSNPRKYGVTVWAEDPGWTRISPGRSVDLYLLANEAGIDPMELIRANQELTYPITPPEPDYYLKVRAVNAYKIQEILARDDLPLINYYIHTISSGDTLSALARHYGISVDQILSVNPGTQAHLLRIGAVLMIPALRDRPLFIRNTVNIDFSGSYTVKQGETLWSIALAHGITPEALAEANNMRINDILSIGRILKTPIID